MRPQTNENNSFNIQSYALNILSAEKFGALLLSLVCHHGFGNSYIMWGRVTVYHLMPCVLPAAADLQMLKASNKNDRYEMRHK